MATCCERRCSALLLPILCTTYRLLCTLFELLSCAQGLLPCCAAVAVATAGLRVRQHGVPRCALAHGCHAGNTMRRRDGASDCMLNTQSNQKLY